jgi:peptide/nickel transport system substrate-binding protein
MPRGVGPVLFLAWLVAGCAEERAGRGATEQVLRVAIHTEPQTWNRLLASDRVTHLVTEQIHEPLLRLDPETQSMLPALAESWELDESGTRLVLHLRKEARFSDGERVTADDVAFTFRALYDASVASPLVETVRFDGKDISVEILDEATVALVLPRPAATVERALDSIPILPSHVLDPSLARGSLPADTGLSATPETIVGAGRFTLREHVPGERIVLARNEHYWNPDAPKLSKLAFEIVPDENARMLKLRSEEIELVELLSPGAFELLRSENPERLELLDVGPGLLSDRLWFNLNPQAPIEDHKKGWFADVRFRQAVSKALDRRALARVVYSGRATPASGPVSVANSLWKDPSLPEIERDLEASRRLLDEAGFEKADDGRLRDSSGNPVELTVITRAGNDQHARLGAFIQQDLAEIGLEVRTVPVEASSLLARLTGSFDYDAAILSIGSTDADPSAEMGFWLSRAPLHLWHPAQESPATPWEARIDELMEAQMKALELDERRESYFEVQRIVYEQLPVIDLVVPHVLLGVNRSVGNLQPSPLTHALWNSGAIALDRGERTTWANRDARH